LVSCTLHALGRRYITCATRSSTSAADSDHHCKQYFTASSTRPAPGPHAPPRRNACPQREDFGSPLAAQVGGYQHSSIRDHSARERSGHRMVNMLSLSWDSRILSTTSRSKYGTQPCCQRRELPGLPYPAPSPHSVSHTLRGLHLTILWWPYFMHTAIQDFQTLI